MKLVNKTMFEKSQCRLCEKIEIKYRRRNAEIERVNRWQREGGNLKASMDRSQKLVLDIQEDIRRLEWERESHKKMLA